jgi:hypothetical protein
VSTSFIGHDTAAELGADLMSYKEVEADIVILENYFKELKKRR